MSLHLTLLGGIALADERGPLGGQATQRHRLALLAILAAAYPRAVSRDKLMACLWPERDSSHARNLLNQAVHAIRRAAGGGAIVSTGEELRLDPDVLPCDVLAFEGALGAGDLEAAVACYGGPFLDGFHLPAASEFEQWAHGERERFAHAHATALETLATRAALAGEVSQAVSWWLRLAAAQPFNGRVIVRLMEALVAAGDRAAAVDQARVHASLLRQEYDAPPDSAVEALRERLQAGLWTDTIPDPVSPTDAGLRRAAEPRPTSDDSHERDSGGLREPPGDGVHTTPALPRGSTGPSTAHWRRRAAIVAGIGIAAAGIAIALRWEREPTLVGRHRVVVIPFENRTGRESLTPIGVMAADWITSGLAYAAVADVVPTTTALELLRTARAENASRPMRDLTALFANGASASIVITGGYYGSGDSLYLHAEIADVRRKRVVGVIEPIAADTAAPLAAVQQLRERTLATLAPLVNERLSHEGRGLIRPPSYQAYQAYVAGSEHFLNGRWREAIAHFTRATSRDTTWVLPRVLAAFAYSNLGDGSATDSIVSRLAPARESLPAYERSLLDLVAALETGDPEARYSAARRAAEIAPGSLSHVQWGFEALGVGRPREALRILEGIDPTRGTVRGWPPYWNVRTQAHHELGEHERELQVARRARELHPETPFYFRYEARALAALGRLAELDALIDRRRMLPDPGASSVGVLLHTTANELREHGHARAARAMYQRALAWFRSRPATEQPRYRIPTASILLALEQLDGAEALFREALLEAEVRVPIHGALGVIAALRGDTATARQISNELGMVPDDPRQSGMQSFWRACIAGHLDRLDEAVSYMREASSRGLRVAGLVHAHVCGRPLVGYRRFEQLVAPQG